MRYALIIACQYEGVEHLEAVADCFRKVCDLLVKEKDYDKCRVKVCTDISHEEVGKYLPSENIKEATKESIKHEIQSTMSQLIPGDRLFFYYTGHGVQLPALTDMEVDGKDECLLTSDMKAIRDDYVYEEMVLKVPKGAVLNAFFKACHSGTIMDIPIVYKSGEKQGEEIIRQVMSPPEFIPNHIGLTFQLSSCLDEELSYSIKEGILFGKQVSVFTRQLVRALRKMNEGSTYNDLIREMNWRVGWFPAMHVAVCSSHYANLDSPFLI